MPFRIDDPLDWEQNMPAAIQQQIFSQMGSGDDLMQQTIQSANPSALDWDGLMGDDIGGETEFGAGDVFAIGVDALSVLSPNSDAVTNLFNLAKWALNAEVGFMAEIESASAAADVVDLRGELGFS